MPTVPDSELKVVALAGGVGGAKLAAGLAAAIEPQNLTVIVNIGDDFEHLGLWISPDLDTVCYTLAGIANPATGWGRMGETWNLLESLAELGGPAWFRIGDRDMATHLERTRRLGEGQPLSQVTREFCRAWGVQPMVLPVSDDRVPTWVYTDEGELPFQEYFVRRQCRPVVTGFEFQGAAQARPAPGVLEALAAAHLVVVCPSNPWVSVDPILAIPGVRQSLASQKVVAVSPIVGGQAIKGPAAKMYAEMGIEPDAVAVAAHYAGLLAGFVLDVVDRAQAESIRDLGMQAFVTHTIMQTPEDRLCLAREVLQFSKELEP